MLLKEKSILLMISDSNEESSNEETLLEKIHMEKNSDYENSEKSSDRRKFWWRKLNFFYIYKKWYLNIVKNTKKDSKTKRVKDIR